MFDKDGDGEISIKELTTVMRSLGLNPTESEIVEIMANLDLDGKNQVPLILPRLGPDALCCTRTFTLTSD